MNERFLGIVNVVIGLAGIGISGFLVLRILHSCDPQGEMKRIADYIKNGAMAYLLRQYKILVFFLAAMAIVLGLVPGLGWKMAVCFLFGAILSVLAGYCGMRTAVIANVRTANQARTGMQQAFRVAFSGGAVMGLMVMCLGALGVVLIYENTKDIHLLTGFSFGASSIALFCRVSGGIYTKAADIAADLVGKVEAGIPEDDPRNPAVIADNVGDNVGDVAGMGADLFESYVGSMISAMMLAAATQYRNGLALVLLLVASGILASIIGILLMQVIRSSKSISKAFHLANMIVAGLTAVIVLAGSPLLTGSFSAFFAIFSGIACGVVIGKFTEIYTSNDYKSVKAIAASSDSGAAANILSGFAAGMRSTGLTVVMMVVAIIVSYTVMQEANAGFFGVALSALGMLSTVGFTVSVDAYGPIADNAGGIAQMSNAGEVVRAITDHLDSVGNTTAAIGKGFSIGSAALTALALFTSYESSVGLTSINLADPRVIGGIMIGGMLTFLFGAMTIESVTKTAQHMITEIRSQFKNRPGILLGTEEPDYRKCVDISTRAALIEMILPGVAAIVAPVTVGLLLGREALAGLLCGATVVGALIAILMSNAGGAWDNAKKYIEEGYHGGKGSSSHKAAVIGDTVGDPLKDTAGPSMNILVKLMSIVALVFVPLFL